MEVPPFPPEPPWPKPAPAPPVPPPPPYPRAVFAGSPLAALTETLPPPPPLPLGVVPTAPAKPVWVSSAACAEGRNAPVIAKAVPRPKALVAQRFTFIFLIGNRSPFKDVRARNRHAQQDRGATNGGKVSGGRGSARSKIPPVGVPWRPTLLNQGGVMINKKRGHALHFNK